MKTERPVNPIYSDMSCTCMPGHFTVCYRHGLMGFLKAEEDEALDTCQ